MKKEKVKSEIENLINFISSNRDTLEKESVIAMAKDTVEMVMKINPLETSVFKDSKKFEYKRNQLINLIKYEIDEITNEHYVYMATGYFQLRASMFQLSLLLD